MGTLDSSDLQSCREAIDKVLSDKSELKIEIVENAGEAGRSWIESMIQLRSLFQ